VMPWPSRMQTSWPPMASTISAASFAEISTDRRRDGVKSHSHGWDVVGAENGARSEVRQPAKQRRLRVGVDDRTDFGSGLIDADVYRAWATVTRRASRSGGGPARRVDTSLNLLRPDRAGRGAGRWL
jgi:hypothetical protein